MSQISHASSSYPESSQLDTRIIGDYKVGAEIGRGSFANVYKGVNLKSQTPVAIKSVLRSKLKNKKLLENLEIEISILKDLKHPHIVELLDSKQTSTHFHLVMEYCSLGDLSYFIKKKDELMKKHPLIKTLFNKYPSPSSNHSGLNKVLVLNYLKQLSSALKFLRSKNLVHRDIKPQNLLLSPPIFQADRFEAEGFVGLPDLPILRIADFGFARFLPNTSLAETLCGSPLYMAPEILNYQKYNAKADLWSVGAVLYEMAVGRPPFKASNHLELFNKIQKAKDKIHFPSSAANLDPQIKRLICSLLKFEPTERMGFNEFFNDEIVNYDLNILLEDVNKDITLEPSQVDENLFISEYISKGEIINNNKIENPDGDYPETIEERSSPGPGAATIKRPTSNEKVPQIKQITQRDIQPITQNSAKSTSPAPSANRQSSQQQIQHQTQVQRRPGFRFNNRGQSSDAVMEKEYVVVEKTAVEVNALADELANAGTGAGAIALPNNYMTQNRRRSSRTSSGGSSGPARRPSFNDRRVSISISPTNALSKALGLASTRLFGNQTNPINNGLSSSPATNSHTLSTINSSNNSFTNNIILNSTNQIINYNSYKTLNANDPDTNITLQLESLATKAHVINLFAEVKFSQLIPSPPSSNSYAIEDEDDVQGHDDMNNLPPDVVKNLADEACLLYVKTLSLLAKAMNIASEWWHNNGNKPDQRLNEIVQWIRERFNEVLEKAEFVKMKLQDARKKLLAQGVPVEEYSDKKIEDKIFAERLIYDRALEIAKNTAKTEMLGNDLLGCELAYSTSIWMLEALLDQDDDSQKLEEADKEMVEKYIESISNRLGALKKKLEGQRS